MGGFIGLEIAKRALLAHRQAMDTAGHNIANARTPGFSRQRVNLQTTPPSTEVATRGGTASVGTGVEVADITRLRDAFLDRQYRDQASGLGSWQTRDHTLSEVEQIFAEPSDTSVRAVLDQFWQSWHTLANNPESLASRETVKQRSLALVETLQTADSQLSELQQNLNTSIENLVEEINTLATQIAGVNAQIAYAQGAGQEPNDLMDQRDLLLDKLAQKTDIAVLDGESGTVRVLINGVALVDGFNAYGLKAEVDTANNNFFGLKWEGFGSVAQVTGGEMAAYLDLRDNTVNNYRTQIKELAWAVATEVNAVHATGFDLNGNAAGDFFSMPSAVAFADEATTGDATFTTYTITDTSKSLWDNAASITVKVNGVPEPPANYTISRLDGTITFAVAKGPGDTITVDGAYLDPTTFQVANLALESAIEGDARQIATAAQTGSPGDGSRALTMAQLRQKLMTDLGSATPDDFYRAMIGTLGTEAEAAQRMAQTQQALVDRIDNQRQAVSGVNLDEEMMDLIRFQHAFQAAARVVNVMDEMISTVVNRLGISGR